MEFDGNIFNTSANAVQGGVDTLLGAANPFAVNMTMNQFLNPYQETVINDFVSRIRDSRDESLNDVRAQAAGAGAYGGARQGLVEAQTIDNFGRAEDEMVARLLQQGFDTSANFALNRLGQQINAGSNLVGAGTQAYNIGQNINNTQNQVGTQQQSLIQQILNQAAGATNNTINSSNNAVSSVMASLTGNPLANATSTTQSYNPGLYDILAFGSGVTGGSK